MSFLLGIGSARSFAIRAAKAVARAEGLEVTEEWKFGDEIPLLVVVDATTSRNRKKDEEDKVEKAIICISGIYGQLHDTVFRGPLVYVMAKTDRATQEAMRIECCFRGGRIERRDQKLSSAIIQLRSMLRTAKREFDEDKRLSEANFKIAL